MSKGHFDLIQKLQTESARERAKLWGQECLIIEKHIQFLLSEMKSATLYKLCHDGNMRRMKAYVNHLNDAVFLGRILANRRGIYGYTPLHEAAANGKAKV